jgi:Circularly permutated YpsA SLOG family
MLRRIVSGGQSGVDRAALDAAGALGIAAGGWCPRGRIAEDGRIRRRYRMLETPSAGYAQRTEWNVRDSDATLIVNRGRLDGGTLLTVQLARRHRKPVFVVQLGRRLRRAQWLAWLRRNRVRVLNVAGPRESKRPGIYREARRVLPVLLKIGVRARFPMAGAEGQIALGDLAESRCDSEIGL